MNILTQRQASDIARRTPFDPTNQPPYEVVDGLWRRVRKQLSRSEHRNNPMRKIQLQHQMGIRT